MVLRSSVIFAASLAVLSTLEPTLGFAAAAPAQHRDHAEKPRFLKRQIKRDYPLSNFTTSAAGPRGPFGQSSSELESLTQTLTTPLSVTPEVTPETTTPPTTTYTTDQGITHDAQWSSSEFPDLFLQQSQTQSTTANTPATSSPASSNTETSVTSATAQTVNTNTNAPPTTTPTANPTTEGVPSKTTTPAGIPDTSSLVAESVTQSTQTAGSTPPTSTQSPVGQSSAIQPPNQSETGSPAGSSSTAGAEQTTTAATIVPTTALTASSEGQSNIRTPSETQTAPSITPSVTPKTQPGATEQSQTDQASLPEQLNTLSVPVVGGLSSSGGQQIASEHEVLPSSSTPVANPIQQPITQPSQTQSNVGGASVPYTTAASEAREQITAANAGIPSNTADLVQSLGETIKSNLGSVVPLTNSEIGITPTAEVSPGDSVIASITKGAQPASSPALPESAVVVPTATANKPFVTSDSVETNSQANALPQGTSKAGVFFTATESNPAVSINTAVLDSLAPTGSALYNALTNALQNSVSPGSTMLPNGVIVPISSVAEGVSQPEQTGTQQAQSSPAIPIVPAASVTLPGGSVVANPSASVGVPLASVTLPGGSVVANPSASVGVPLASITLPGGSVVANPSGSAVVPLASITLPGGSVVANPSGSAVVPAVSITLPGGSVVPNPAATQSDTTLAPVLPASVTLPGGSVIPNPAASIIPSAIASLSGEPKEIVTPPPSGASGVVAPNTLISDIASLPSGSNVPVSNALGSSGIGGVLSDTLQGSGAQTQASATDSNGVVVPLQTTSPVNTAAAETGSISGISPVVVGSASNTNGVVVPVTAGQTTGSTTISGGSVIPLIASSATAGSGSTPIVVGSATNSNGVALPITSGEVTGSSTLPGGSVVPLIASAPTASPASGSPVTSGAGSGSNTLSAGSVVPIASANVSPTAATGQATGAAGQTAGATEPKESGATSAPQSGLGSQPAPAPVTGTATAPPNTAGTLAPQATDQHYQSNAKGPFTQLPTGYDTATAQSVPTSILAQPSSMSPSQTSQYGSTGLPTGWPLVLYPPVPVTQPDNTDLIQIGFLYPLNYEFVWQNQDSQKQIFKYLPMGIAWGLQIAIENVTMQTLRAWDTTQDLHYVTTLALAWIPTGLVDSLGLLVHTPTSRFYHTPDNSTNTLLSMINIALPIAADNGTDGGSNIPGDSPSSTATLKDGGAPVGGGIGSSNPVRASSAGIGIGVACGAAAYGAAMFFVARRYKKRRQSHLRSPSMFSSPVMSHVGPDAGAGAALMSGAMGDHRSPSPYHDNDGRAASRGSGRSGSTGRQQISAPVMAENSLGWN